nr:MAG TPA: hypothetical protein [Caudoviricetes sp.]
MKIQSCTGATEITINFQYYPQTYHSIICLWQR